jgi:cell division protein FtsQ
MMDWKKYLPLAGMFVVVAFSIGFVEQKQQERYCQDIHVVIDQQEGHFFLHEDDIIDALTVNGEYYILETPLDELNLKVLEDRLRQNPFVERADVFVDLKGTLTAQINQLEPLARLVVSGKQDRYISTSGLLFPESERYTARVPLISGPWINSITGKRLENTSSSESIWQLLTYIHNDPFWKSQIAQFEIDEKGNITMLPQVTKQIIEFGTVTGYEQKFKKLKVFYKEVLPRKGWNHYERVNLAYQNQIICE